MKILAFSASPRKIHLDVRHILNPSYWLLGALVAQLANDETVYVVEQSMSPVGRLRPYRGERIDMMLVMGCSYSPGSMTASFNRGNPRHRRVFDIADVVKTAYQRYRPEVVEMTADVRDWTTFPEVTETFGFQPDRKITEQEMNWQAVGYYYASKLASTNRLPRERRFAFCGGAKNRFEKFRGYVSKLSVPAVVHGGGWAELQIPGVRCDGFKPYHESVRLMLSSQYSLTLHEPLGEQAGWITARWYENLGCGLVNFTDRDYDRGELVLPHDHELRVATGDELANKIAGRSYGDWIELQRGLIRPEWSQWSYYYEPFRERLLSSP